MDINEGISDCILANLRDIATDEQKVLLDNWLKKSLENRIVFAKLVDAGFVSEQLKVLSSFDDKKSWHKIEQYVTNTHPVTIQYSNKLKWTLLAIAAVFIILVGGIYMISNTNKLHQQHQIVIKTNDVKSPVLSKAFIKTDNGKIVSLDSIKANTVFSLNNAKVIKDESGQLRYLTSTQKQKIYNTLYNPRGSNIVTLVLADGTKVWLNSESSINYPVQFDNSSRDVFVIGEAYFEVAKSKTQKFIVSTKNGMKIEVLGTHFDVKDYAEESSANVTLMEGSVLASNDKNKILLIPQQQATQNTNTGVFTVRKANLDKVIAWKSGVFNFEDDDIYTLTKELARWYDVKVQINASFSPETYTGIINRNLSLVQVLQILKLAGVNYEIKENTLSINKN